MNDILKLDRCLVFHYGSQYSRQVNPLKSVFTFPLGYGGIISINKVSQGAPVPFPGIALHDRRIQAIWSMSMTHTSLLKIVGLACMGLIISLCLVTLDATASDQPTPNPSSIHTANSDHPTPSETDAHPKDHPREHASSHGDSDLGSHLPLTSCLPFAGMLLSIALWPLIAPEFWHHHFGKISAFWSVCLAVPFVIIFRGTAVYEIIHIMLADYVPFIILLWSLYTVSGGILLRGTLTGTPMLNVAILLIGTILASWMGTTGAAMLLIRPFLRANKNRKNRTFMVVFFIFLVANIGGSLTPLGDPPLFLGFLHGVSFFWTFNIAPHMVCMVLLLLSIYYALDKYFYTKEKRASLSTEGQVIKSNAENHVPLALEGVQNFLFLAGIVGAVLMSGIVDWGDINTLGVHRGLQDWVRDALLVIFGILSLVATSAKIRQDNEFTWFPIQEVAYLFVGIFITMIPCLLILKAGSEGALAFIINSVSQPAHYFWVTGMLSSFLDNAPTYLTFFNTALGSFFAGMAEPQAVELLMSEKSVFLKAISSGAVFFGACSYIGNAPNFMVRAISEEAGTPMPSFFGYILKYSLVFLIPSFVVITLIFF
jgi:Na+/H+ antiporter NhaD/arsenite permease-like protein